MATASLSVESLDTVERKDRWLQLGYISYAKIGIIALLLFILYRHEIMQVVSKWSDPSWSHGILIPFFSLYFINQKKYELLNLTHLEDPLKSILSGRAVQAPVEGQTRPSYIGLVLLLCCIVFYPFNIVQLQYGYFSSLTVIATIGAVVLFLGGWGVLRYTWLPIGFLVFAVPIPQRYYVAITMPMRILAAKVATVLLNFVEGMEATANGVVIDVFYNGQTLEPPLNVAEACSGMRLLTAFVALGVAMAYLHYRPIWQRVVLLACTIPIAIFCNIVRVTVTGFIYIFIDPKYAHGIYHDMLGFAMLPLAFGIYGFLAWFMTNLVTHEQQEVVEDVIVRRRQS